MEDILTGLMFLGLTAITLFFTFKYSIKGMRYLQSIDLSGQDYHQQLVELLFTEGREKVLNDVNALKASPLAFIQNHSAIFEPRDIDEEYVENFELLFKSVLAYHLNKQGNFLILDYKQSGYDGLNSINWLLNNNEISSIPATEKENAKRGIPPKYLDYESRDFLDTNSLLIHVTKILNRFETTLIEFAFGGDTFEVFVLPKNKVPALFKLSDKLKMDLVEMN